MNSFRAYVYCLAIVQMAIAMVIFNEMRSHGWIEQATAESLAFALSLIGLLTLAFAASDLMNLLTARFTTPLSWRAHAISLLVVAGFAAFGGAGQPNGYAAAGYRFGIMTGLLPALRISLRAEPVASYVARLEDRLESRGDLT